MTVGSVGSPSNVMIQSLVQMRSQFDDLQRQLSSGHKANTYAGLGLGSGTSVGLNAQLSALTSFDASIGTASTQLKLTQQALTGMTNLAGTVRGALVQANGSTGTAMTQSSAQSALQQALGLLNTQYGDRYIFSGRATDQPSVDTYDHILNGNGAQAGLTQLISERNQADLGSNQLGRLAVANAPADTVSLAEDGSSFGFKLGSASSTLSNATAAGPTGSPPSFSVQFTGQPQAGQVLSLSLNLPDGTSQTLNLAATTQSPPGAGQFTIGATPADTAANLKNALTSSLGTLAKGALTAASAVATSNDFFAADASQPPQRVAGPPFDTATGTTAGTAANTVIWYTGEVASDPARSSATARIDPSLVVSYGTRANEQGIRSLIASLGTLAAVPPPAANSDADVLNNALSQRLMPQLSGTGGGQSVADIATDLAGVQTSMQNMQAKHQQTTNTLTDVLQQITGVSTEQVGAEMLTLQTQMQASMQTTAMLLQTNLVNYLK